MNQFTLFPLNSYKAKIVGIILSIFSVILMVLEKINQFIVLKNLDPSQHLQLLFLLLLAGLFIIAFSKEKIDDDRINLIRGKAFQIGFGMILAISISFSVVCVLSPTMAFNTAHALPLIILISLSIYLIVFNVGIYLDLQSMYNNGSALLNIKKNKAFFLVYLLFLVLIAGYLILY